MLNSFWSLTFPLRTLNQGTHFPQRLSGIYLVNPNMGFNMIWGMVKGQLKPPISNLTYLLPKSTMAKTLNQHLGSQAFESIYGGALSEGVVRRVTLISQYSSIFWYCIWTPILYHPTMLYHSISPYHPIISYHPIMLYLPAMLCHPRGIWEHTWIRGTGRRLKTEQGPVWWLVCTDNSMPWYASMYGQ